MDQNRDPLYFIKAIVVSVSQPSIITSHRPLKTDESMECVFGILNTIKSFTFSFFPRVKKWPEVYY